MNYLVGIVNASLSGYGNVRSKAILEKEELGSFLKTLHLLRMFISLPIIMVIRLSEHHMQIDEYRSQSTILLLIVYLLARVVSNYGQLKLGTIKEMDVGLSTTIFTTSCFLSLILNKEAISVMQILMILLAIVGVVLATVDVKHLKFTIPKSCIIYLTLVYIASGTKAVMVSRLLLSFNLSQLVLLEILSYVVLYFIVYRKSKINKQLMIKLIPLALFTATALMLEYVVCADIKVYMITSFVTSLVATIASIFILKVKVSKEVYVGISIISVAVILFKVC